MDFINTWGAALESEYILSDSLSKYDIGATVKCIAEDDEIVTCQYGNKTVQIRKSGFVQRKTPEFEWNDTVKVRSKNIEAQIELICWHYKEKRYFYYLISDGKRMKKRYYAEELEKI